MQILYLQTAQLTLPFLTAWKTGSSLEPGTATPGEGRIKWHRSAQYRSRLSHAQDTSLSSFPNIRVRSLSSTAPLGNKQPPGEGLGSWASEDSIQQTNRTRGAVVMKVKPQSCKSACECRQPYTDSQGSIYSHRKKTSRITTSLSLISKMWRYWRHRTPQEEHHAEWMLKV